MVWYEPWFWDHNMVQFSAFILKMVKIQWWFMGYRSYCKSYGTRILTYCQKKKTNIKNKLEEHPERADLHQGQLLHLRKLTQSKIICVSAP